LDNNASPAQSKKVAMDIKGIRYFIAVAELGSISRAAEQLGVVQPA
jgi:molybdenum-dependent DNA-binding transcriptional regulator ModE